VPEKLFTFYMAPNIVNLQKKKSPWERQLPNSVASIRHCAWDCARFQANNGEVSVGGGRATDEHLALLLLLMFA
jgi:hypothetical protein